VENGTVPETKKTYLKLPFGVTIGVGVAVVARTTGWPK